MDARTVTAPDAITAFAVPNPGPSSQKRSVFSGSGARRVAPAADHPAYFGSANVNLLTLSAIDVPDSNYCSKSCQCLLLVQFISSLPLLDKFC